ncbi:MAG: phage holin family protein [Candidatus Absconditabacterales bacterium]
MKIIKHFVITIVINAVILYIIANYADLGFKVTSVLDTSNYKNILIIFGILGGIFWITNSLLRSILKTLTLPVKYLTLGISGLIINILLLYVFEQGVNYADIGITITLGTLSQTFILSLIITFVHLLIKKIL